MNFERDYCNIANEEHVDKFIAEHFLSDNCKTSNPIIADVMNSHFTEFEISADINEMKKKKLVVRMVFQQKLCSRHWKSSCPFLLFL